MSARTESFAAETSVGKKCLGICGESMSEQRAPSDGLNASGKTTGAKGAEQNASKSMKRTSALTTSSIVSVEKQFKSAITESIVNLSAKCGLWTVAHRIA